MIDTVRQLCQGQAVIRCVDLIPKGVRIQTNFLYPEGSNIDLFLLEGGPPFRISDLGNSYQWLLNVQIRPWLDLRYQVIIDEILQLYGVIQNGGAFELSISSLDEFLSGVVRLGQVCFRVTDLTLIGIL